MNVRKSVRVLLFVGPLAVLAALAAMSIVGAFLGAQSAQKVFTSYPLIAFWIATVGLLVGSVVFSRNILCRPSSLAMHIGSAVVLVGAMLGSDQGHALTAKYLGIDRIPHGYVRIVEGQRSNQVFDEHDHPVGRLPFSIGLDEFDVDYYPPREDGWQLVMRREEPSGDVLDDVLDWKLDRPIRLPGTPNEMTVTQYLPHAREVYPEIQANLEIQDKAGNVVNLPAVAGQETQINDPPAKIKVVRFIKRMVVRGRGDVIDDPTAREQPAIEFDIAYADGKTNRRIVTQRPELAGIEEDGVTYEYQTIHPTATADPRSDRPAMELKFSDPMGNQTRVWLIVPKDSDSGSIDTPDFSIWLGQREDVKQYRSKVAIFHGDKAVGAGDIEVNKPMNFEGYGLFQTSYGQSAEGPFTVLTVRSRLGLEIVYVGFALVTVGAFAFFWGRGIAGYLRRRHGHGD